MGAGEWFRFAPAPAGRKLRKVVSPGLRPPPGALPDRGRAGGPNLAAPGDAQGCPGWARLHIGSAELSRAGPILGFKVGPGGSGSAQTLLAGLSFDLQGQVHGASSHPSKAKGTVRLHTRMDISCLFTGSLFSPADLICPPLEKRFILVKGTIEVLFLGTEVIILNKDERR